MFASCGLLVPASGPERGHPVPDLAGTTLDGESLDLADLRGRPVVVNFWGPSCIPCRDEFPLMLEKLAEHEDEGLAIVGVLTDDPEEPARDFVEDFGATWPTITDPGGELKERWRVVGRPTSFFIDRDGILQSVQIGEFLEPDFDRQYARIRG